MHIVYVLLDFDIRSCNHVDGSVQDCSNASALAMELSQSCTKPSICTVAREQAEVI